MFKPGSFSPLIFLSLFICAIPTSLAAPATPKCTLTDVHNAIADWRTDKALLIDGYKIFAKLVNNFEIIESRLSGSCDGLKDHLSKTSRFLAILQPAGQIPKLKVLVKPVQKIGEKLNLVVLKKPHDTVCKTVLKIRTQIDSILTKFKKVEDTKIVTVLKAFDSAHGAVAEALILYENTGGKPTNCVPLNQLCAAVRGARDLQRGLIQEIEDLIKKSAPLQKFMSNVDTAVKSVSNFVDKIFKGPAGKVMNEVDKLLRTRITLPIPRGSKERGVGVVPTCCPAGRTLHAGLCYTTCRSGYAQVLFTCVEKCKPGWTDIGVSCTRLVTKKVGFVKIKVPQFDTKHSYTRSGIAPAVFGNAACSCRRVKRYLEAGLCYNKCGRDSFARYQTRFLTQCLDLRSTTLTIADLAKNLNIFKQAEKIPVLGEAVKKVNQIIDKVFNALTKPIKDALKVVGPKLNIPVNIPTLSLDGIAGAVNLDILRTAEKLASELLRATSCKNNNAEIPQ